MGIRDRIRLLIVSLCAMMAAPPALAQEQDTKAFRVVDVTLAVASDLGRSSLFHQYWHPGRGISVAVSTPFRVGFVELGGSLQRYEPLGEVPGFGAWWLYAGWGLRWSLKDRIRFSGSARLGNFGMSFDDTVTEFFGVANENEMGRMFRVAMDVRIVGPFSISAAASHLRVYTYQRLSLWFVYAGLAYTFPMPKSLRNFFR